MGNIEIEYWGYFRGLLSGIEGRVI